MLATDHLVLLSISKPDQTVSGFMGNVFGSTSPKPPGLDKMEQVRAEEFSQAMMKEACKIVSEYSEKLSGDAFNMSHEIVELGENDSPKKAICDFVKEKEATMLIVGSRGVSGLEKMLGSVSDYVSANACCPVLIVR